MTSTRAYLSPPPAVAPFIPSGVFYDAPSVPGGVDLDGEEYSDEDEECELFDPSDRFFPVSHDLFLVQQCCFHPESRMADVVTRFEREFGVPRTAQELEERLKRLESPDFRALFVLYLKAVALDKDAQLGGHVTLGALANYQPLLDSARTSCETRLFQLLYEDEKFRQDACESVTIEVTGRSFPKYSRVASKAELRRCCRVIDDLYRSAGGEVVVSSHQSCSLHAVDTQREHLSLTDTVAFYDSCNGFNHMEQPIIDRLVLFAKDPNIMERLTLQKQQQKEAARIKRASNQELRSIFDKQRQRQAERLEQLRSDSLEQTRAQLEKAMEDDIEHIRRMHAQLLKHEEAKIHAKYDELQAAMHDRVKNMQREVLALQKSCESSGWHGLEQGIMGTSLHIEKIFGTSDFLLRLLILAEDLEARPLRQALIRYLSDKNRLQQFALRREMTSKLIADSTVLAILKGTSTQDLREVEGYGKNFLHHDLVARELHTRKIELGRFLAGLTNDQLRSARRLQLPKGHHTVATAGNDNKAEDVEDNNSREKLDVEGFEQFASLIGDFPEILDQEFARRRDFSCVKMSSVGIERDVSFSEEDCVLQLETPHRYCTVPATKERKQGESGKWMFEVTVEVFGGDGESLLIGWEIPRDERDVSSDAGAVVLASRSPSRASSPSARASFSHTATAPSTLVPGLSPSADGRSFGVTWQSDGGLEMGMLHANGQSRSGVPCFRAGDVVGCTIDQDHAVPHLRFYLNGDLALPVRADNSSNSNSSSNSHGHVGSIAVLNPAYCLAPVVSMYSSKRKPQTRVRLNFRGGFRFPVAGFDPFGAPLD